MSWKPGWASGRRPDAAKLDVGQRNVFVHQAEQ